MLSDHQRTIPGEVGALVRARTRAARHRTTSPTARANPAPVTGADHATA